jgi:hypothetical protein
VTILIDSKTYPKDDFGASFDFLFSHGLIELKEYVTKYKVSFVGEVITPFGYFISLPKNFKDLGEGNVELVKLMLREFKNVKRRGKLLISCKSYDIGNEIESEYQFWRKLYSFFIDYITYEFYYPKKKVIKHSLIKLNGKISPLFTDLNNEKMGRGITYEMKDFSENCFRNIFYSTLKKLENKFASDIESRKIKEVESYLKQKSIMFQEKEIIPQEFLSYAKRLQTNPIHEIIVKTLVAYYSNMKIEEKNTINVFYTREFEYLYQYILQQILLHDPNKRNTNWSDPNYKKLYPDIVTDTFIGDAKYYTVSDSAEYSFEKELYAYNIANRNSQKNYIFILADETKFIESLIHVDYQLDILVLDLKQILTDYNKKEFKVLNFVNSVGAGIPQIS